MPRKSSSKKRNVEKDINSMSKREMEELLKADKQENKSNDNVSAGSFVVYLFPAFLVVGLPVYLFISPMFALNLKDEAATFGGVTFFSSILLALSYGATARRNLRSILKKRKVPLIKDQTKAQSEAKFNQSCKSESMAYSLFKNNLVFVLLFLFMCFWLVPGLPLDIPKSGLYGVSVVTPAFLIFLNTHGILNI